MVAEICVDDGTILITDGCDWSDIRGGINGMLLTIEDCDSAIPDVDDLTITECRTCGRRPSLESGGGTGAAMRGANTVAIRGPRLITNMFRDGPKLGQTVFGTRYGGAATSGGGPRLNAEDWPSNEFTNVLSLGGLARGNTYDEECGCAERRGIDGIVDTGVAVIFREE